VKAGRWINAGLRKREMHFQRKVFKRGREKFSAPLEIQKEKRRAKL